MFVMLDVRDCFQLDIVKAIERALHVAREPSMNRSVGSGLSDFRCHLLSFLNRILDRWQDVREADQLPMNRENAPKSTARKRARTTILSFFNRLWRAARTRNSGGEM